MAPEQRARVGFVGAGLRPEPATLARLAEAGLHGSWFANAVSALAAARAVVFDAVFLDAAQATPLALLGLREGLACPLLVVGAHDEEVDEIVALECGADAWLHGPLAPRRLIAHVQALMRLSRRQGAAARLPARFEGWTLCRSSGRLVGPGHALTLAQTQTRLLAVLMDAAGQAVSRQELRAALPRGDALEARAVDVYLSRLRMRLTQERVLQLRVQPVRGCGYALEAGAAEPQPMMAREADAEPPPVTIEALAARLPAHAAEATRAH